ncbi:beta-glucosidase [Geosmithia morbida]|uniref:beta-glucosidase n=1 Tax=Geosmithia morbida TaxID=1094350 RepID=A0A9P4YVP0_9HYPO|nr:beta-glucosidase [Geosmithia morbida]KAF4122890.1 beta-glucosidase [Geosmithia morbida]
MAAEESKQGLLDPHAADPSSMDGEWSGHESSEDIELESTSSIPPRKRFGAFPDVSDRIQVLLRPADGRSWGRIALISFGALVIFLVLSGGGLFRYKKHNSTDAVGKHDRSWSPPWYPSPRGGTLKEWESSYQKASELVSKMTLPEKVNITTGTGWKMGPAVGNTGPALGVGFPSLALQDGPLGIRLADNITAFPAGVTVGATWNRELMYDRGKAHGLEARAKGINVILGPSVGAFGRIPAGGRNWEGFGPDPYLQGVACSETIRGIQDQHVMATIKHFIANEQEHFRQPHEWGLENAISSNLDDRTLHEIYAWPFADAIKAGVASVMCSYNQVNNSYACANSKLLNGILKDEMGFQGFIMSDWLAQRSGVDSALAGLDMSMPGDGLNWEDGKSLWGPKLTQAVLNGTLPMSRLDDMVTRIVASWYQLGQDDKELFDREGPNFSSFSKERMGVEAPGSPSPQTKVEVNKFIDVKEDHDKVAYRVALEGTVLLKNDGILPITRNGEIGLDKKKKEGRKLRVGIFGEDAGPGDGPNACPDRGCNQGTLGSGWGSGAVEFPYLITPEEELRKGFNESEVDVFSFLDNDLKNLKNATALEDRDICFVFANSDAGEGFISWNDVKGDRNDLHLQKGGDDLIKEVSKRCGGGKGSTIVVYHSVGPVIVEEWIDKREVKGVFAAHLPGQESGRAIAALIFGDEGPSGRLPYTMGRTLKDYGNTIGVIYDTNEEVPQQNFEETLYIDYRHYDKFLVPPRFAFGYGLTYARFELKDIRVKEVKGKSALPGERPPPSATPPEYDGKIPPAEDVLFPPEIRKLDKYVYPYLESAESATAAGTKYQYPEGYDVEAPLSDAGGGEGGHPDLWETHVIVSIEVGNVGHVPGHAVPQLYLSYPPLSEAQGVEFPKKVLRGFEKVYLEPGEWATVDFEITRRDLSYWDVKRQNWVMLEQGRYVFTVGNHAKELRLQESW